MNNCLHPGDKVYHIVGMPGPDLDIAYVVSKNSDDSYTICYQVYEQGPWYEGVGHLNKYGIGGIFKYDKR
jgi:hypothetical protein